jgi:sugar phosphate isomerase/epimerase
MNNSAPFSRRTFLAMAGAMPLAAAGWAQTKSIPIGLELYSVRDDLMKDPKGTVTAVAKLGYQVVEFYSPYFKWTLDEAKEMRKLLDDLGVKCLSTHNGAAAIGEGISKAIELNQAIGSKYIVLASPGKVAGVDGWKELAGRLAAAAEKLRPLGMATGFHNHQSEWRPIEGTSQRPMDILAAGTPKDVALQLDCGTCVEAGADPVAWIKANPGRIKSTHLKDWSKANGYAVAFNEGDVPWKPLLAAAESTGGVEYHLIEQEVSAPGGAIAMAEKCLANYKKLRG